MKRLFLILTLFFGFHNIVNGSQTTQDLKGDDVFPLRNRAYTKAEVSEGFMKILHPDNVPLMSEILNVFFRKDFPKTPFTVPQEIKCWQCFFNTARGNLCAANLPTADDSKATQLNAIAIFLGHHKTSNVSGLYPEIFKHISEDYPHKITDMKALMEELHRVAEMPVNGDLLRSSM